MRVALQLTLQRQCFLLFFVAYLLSLTVILPGSQGLVELVLFEILVVTICAGCRSLAAVR